MQKESQPLDVIIIGAGVSGLNMLHYALKENLNAIVLEKSDQVGGLWATLPEWQDIQFRKEEWSVNNLPVAGVSQPDILKNIQSMPDHYGLHGKIYLSHTVEGVTFGNDIWQVNTSKKNFYTRSVVVCSGLHNIPKMPDFTANDFNGMVYHSSQLRSPESLAGKIVTVVGGGASAYDLLDLALIHHAKEIHWIYRGLRWMIPSTQPKDARSIHRDFALAQMMGKKMEVMNSKMNQLLEAKYTYFGIEEIKPSFPFDYRKMTILPGRSEMIKQFKKLHRHPGTFKQLKGKELIVEKLDGTLQSITSDIVLFGTGYTMDLSYLKIPEYRQLTSQQDLSLSCNGLMESKAHQNLYFVGPTIAETSSSAPLATAILARSLAKIIRKGKRMNGPIIEEYVNHWDLFKMLAPHDRYHFPKIFWRLRYLAKAMWYKIKNNESISI